MEEGSGSLHQGFQCSTRISGLRKPPQADSRQNNSRKMARDTHSFKI